MEVLEQLGIEPGIMVVNVVGFLILLALLSKFAFGPVGQILDDRRREVEANLDEAERMKQMALADKRAIEEELEKVNARAEEILAEAESEAAKRRSEILARADEERRRIIEEGERAVEHSANEARRRLRAETAELAREISERALRLALDEQRQAALVEAFIADIEQLADGQSEGERT